MTEKLKPITVIGASAGTGKTFRLASDFTKSVSTGETKCPTEIIATTFTNKAAHELAGRIRQFLLREGRWAEAQATLASSIGTVNSVCGRMLSDLAIDAGLSPSVKLIAEERQPEVFKMAVEAMVNAHAADLRPVLYRMSKEGDEWWQAVVSVVEIARQNNIDPATLISFGQTSWLSLKSLLPQAASDDASFQAQLKAALKSTLSNLPATNDATKTTVTAIKTLSETNRIWDAMGDLPWEAVVRISKVKPAKLSIPIVQSLQQIALMHTSAPQFHIDLETFINRLFFCAADCLKAYKQFKEERGLLDFIDQEELSYALLKRSEITEALQGRFSTLFVDEFQDTSPIQLAVFLELARLVGNSIWVGDEKQSIFGFRGADPILMQQVVERVLPETGGRKDNLTRSYRSRPKLVSFVNSVFVRAMKSIGIRADSVEIKTVSRAEMEEMNEPLHVWWLGGTSHALAVRSMANGVLSILQEPDKWKVCVSNEASCRAIKGSDIAILCRTNPHRLEIADALASLGIVVSTERSGLLETPESALSIAVLRYLADGYDTLAMAEIVRFTDRNSVDDQAWLHEWIEKGTDHIAKNVPALLSLTGIRDQLIGLTPVECLQVATTAPVVMETILKWGRQRQRMLNLEALVGLAQSYQEICATDHQTASVAGLITFLETNCQDALQPANPDEQAVHVLTYHKAKGLEWPMVIMSDLGEPRGASPFDSPVQKTTGDFDPYSPLAARSIRYWPNPYGLQITNTDLETSSQSTPEMTEASRQRTAEYLRLLYVGMTRPRDYLIMACRPGRTGPDWLHMAKDEDGISVFQLDPSNLGKQVILRDAPEITAQCTSVEAADQFNAATINYSETRYKSGQTTKETPGKLPYACIPSRLQLKTEPQTDKVLIDKRIHLGERLPLSQEADMRALGDSLHLFLATDNPHLKFEERLAQADKIASDFKIKALPPDQFVVASTRLRDKLDELYPDARWLTEWPVTGRHGAQRIHGTIDLLLELSEGYVIIDHKSFPGPYDAWDERATKAYPQLDAYAKLVYQATNKNVITSYIHMPIVGALLSFKSTDEWASEESDESNQESWLVL